MRPICSRHYAKMVAYCSTRTLTYYRCQVENCEERMKIPRALNGVPGQPTYCSVCDEAMIVTDPVSEHGVFMQCPHCQRVVALAVV